MHSIYHDVAEGSKTLTTEWKEKFEINQKLKDVALFLQEANVGRAEQLSMLNNLLQTDSVRLSEDDLQVLLEKS